MTTELARRRDAHALMDRFAERTGLRGAAPPRRYLWTDAFGVCNFLALGDDEQALRLVAAVHETLGRHRPDDRRRGWLGDADDAHPTRGGLRIGKPLPERGPADSLDDELEWERDGQYFHYLTRWIHALDRVAAATGRALFRDWARELARTAVARFVQGAPGGRRLYWKMSIDLTRPLVASTGQHDPLDGYLSCLQLGLDREAAVLAPMIEPTRLATDDPLGLGGLLVDAWRVEQLARSGAEVPVGLRDALLGAALPGLRLHARRAPPPHLRLAFRELGLAIGLAAVEHMAAAGVASPALDEAARHAGLGATIEADWLDAGARRSPRYREHEDINDVMLATRLVPAGYLTVAAAR